MKIAMNQLWSNFLILASKLESMLDAKDKDIIVIMNYTTQSHKE